MADLTLRLPIFLRFAKQAGFPIAARARAVIVTSKKRLQGRHRVDQGGRVYGTATEDPGKMRPRRPLTTSFEVT